jgi:Rrf2 family iron-sulfur cluster assembly transcriptional regulator
MLSKSGIHAVRALIYLAELPEGQFAGAVSVAGEIDAPKNYLGKILQQLSRDGVLVSQKGLGGGFRLAKGPKDISLFDVVEPIEQISRWSGCILGGATCSEHDPCAIHDRWRGVKEAYLNMLTKTTLADLVRQQKQAGK